jgi:Carboxypeptidase regulatory-like domain/TonB dependent receptor/TonB-dependent Receptor Plug Domain
MNLNRRIAIALVAALLLLPLSARAATTGTLAGTVTDSSGATLAGVTVTVTSPQLLGARSAQTNASGEYILALLPPGTYRMEFVLDGFTTVMREDVRVGLDTTTDVDVPLALGIAVGITVTADAVVIDPTQTTVQHNFGTEHLKYAVIGSAGRSYQNVLQQAPGVAGGANPQVMGANLGQNSFLLDGVNTTDPVTHTFGSNLPFDAIQEISIQTLGKDAEYGRAVGGVVNVVTKSGGNELSGTLDTRYTSDQFSETNAFYGDEQDYQNFQPSATLGGPVVRDRMWFFGTLERIDNKATAPPVTYGGDLTIAPGTFAFDGWNSLFKITATPAANHTLSLRYTDNRATIANTDGTATYSPEADGIQDQDSQIYNLGYDAILSPQWLTSVQVGVRGGYLETAPKGDVSTPSVLHNDYGFFSQNYNNWQYGERNRKELIASTTYFLQGAGSHTLKGGLNLDQAEFSSFNNSTGIGAFDDVCTDENSFALGVPCSGLIHVVDARDAGGSAFEPFYADVFSVKPEETYESNLSAFYVQDEWHPIDAITARIGLRYETMDFKTPGNVANQPQFSELQPRIGVAWDLFNNARTIVHGFWGQIMDDNGLSLSSFASAQPSTWSRFLYNPATGRYDIYVDTPQNGSSGNQYDPDLRATVSNEANFGLTQRIGSNTSLDVTGLWRKSDNMFEDACFDEDCHFYWMTNKPNGLDVLQSEYKGAIVKLESRPFSWLSGTMSYTWSESEGSVEYTQNAGADFDVYPAHYVNRLGALSDDARHRVKASGFIRAPFGTTFGLDGFWESGSPDDVTADLGVLGAPAGYGTLFLLPRGTRRLESLHRLDFQAIHEFDLGKVNIGLIGTVHNLLGSDAVTNLGSSIGGYAPCIGGDGIGRGPVVDAGDARAGDCVANPLWGVEHGEDRPEYRNLYVSSSAYGLAVDGQRPRRYEVGLRFEF